MVDLFDTATAHAPDVPDALHTAMENELLPGFPMDPSSSTFPKPEPHNGIIDDPLKGANWDARGVEYNIPEIDLPLLFPEGGGRKPMPMAEYPFMAYNPTRSQPTAPIALPPVAPKVRFKF